MTVNKHKLISAIYAATLSPEKFDKVFDDLGEAVLGAEQEGILNPRHPLDHDLSRVSVDPDLLHHIETARQIQGRVEREKVSQDAVSSLIEAVPNPTYLIDKTASVMALNELARSKHQELPDHLHDCVHDERARADILNYLGNGKDQKLFVIPGYGEPNSEILTSILVKQIDEQRLPAHLEGRDLYLLTIVDFGFDQITIELFQQSYSLTGAEAEVAVMLARGMQHAEIAKERNVSLQTIRTQVKTIKNKTNVRDIPALVRLLCGFSAGILVPHNIMSKDQDDDLSWKSRNSMTLSDGRRLDYLEQGSKNGSPVLILHNMPYGAELPTAAIRAAHHLNLRFIAPHRPGYGGTDPLPNLKGSKLLAQVAQDHKELLDHLQVSKVTLVGQTIGTAYALRFATLYPENVEAMIAVSHIPMWRNEWMALSPKHQRMVMRITQSLPQLLPLVFWAFVKCMEAGYSKQLIHTAIMDSQADERAFADPETERLMIASCDTGLEQGVDAFCKDLELTVSDFSEEARQCSHKFSILHGDDDVIINRKIIHDFMDAVPGTELTPVKDAGQLLIYSHWDSILGLITKKRQDGKVA